MSEGGFFRRLHGATIRVQVPVILATIPLAAWLYGVTVAPMVMEVAMEGERSDARSAARDATMLLVWMLVACVGVATAGAALLLRGSVRAVVERMHHATRAIARGDFTHRIGDARGDELGRLASSIDTMAERLERLEQARRRLLACVSHELRTPLTIIRGHAYTLGRSERDALRLERLQLVESEAVRLGELIEDLVDASSLHAGSVRLRVERCDLVDVVARVADRFREEAAMRGLRIEQRCSQRAASVDGDPGRIEQLLDNLFANALRHAIAGTAIEVAISAGRGSAPRAVTVANRGPAIPRQLAERIFEPFVQGDGAHGRVGLGLAIAQGLAVAHGGLLTLASTGQGTGVVAFRLVLPAPDRHESRTAPLASQLRTAAAPPAPRLRAVES